MSRSYKKSPRNGRWLRKPRGRKAAIIRGSRNKGIPPDPWDDIRISDEAMFIYKYTDRLYKKKISKDKAIKMIVNKFGVSYKRASDVVESCWRFGFR